LSLISSVEMVMTTGNSTERPTNNSNQSLEVVTTINGGNINKDNSHKLKLDSLEVVLMTTGDTLPHKSNQDLLVEMAMITGKNIERITHNNNNQSLVVVTTINGGNINKDNNHKLKLDSLVVVLMTTGDTQPHKLKLDLLEEMAMTTGNSTERLIHNNNNQSLEVVITINGGNINKINNHKFKVDSLVAVLMTTGDMLPHKLKLDLLEEMVMTTGKNIERLTHNNNNQSLVVETMITGKSTETVNQKYT